MNNKFLKNYMTYSLIVYMVVLFSWAVLFIIFDQYSKILEIALFAFVVYNAFLMYPLSWHYYKQVEKKYEQVLEQENE